MKENPYKNFKVGDMSAENYSTKIIDRHRPYVDGIVLVSAFPCGPDSMTDDAIVRCIQGNYDKQYLK